MRKHAKDRLQQTETINESNCETMIVQKPNCQTMNKEIRLIKDLI